MRNTTTSRFERCDLETSAGEASAFCGAGSAIDFPQSADGAREGGSQLGAPPPFPVNINTASLRIDNRRGEITTLNIYKPPYQGLRFDFSGSSIGKAVLW